MQTGGSREEIVRVAIRSGRRLFRDALASWLTGQEEFSITGHVATDEDLLELCVLLETDLVLFDAGADVEVTLPALGVLRKRFERVRIVVVYDQLSPAELTAARQVGVDTLVPCSHGLPALLVVLRREAGSLRARTVPLARSGGSLTAQEREIIALVGAGHTVGRIADLLASTPCAVENSKRRIYHKLGVASQSQAIARAASLGLVDPWHPGAGSARRPGGLDTVAGGADRPAPGGQPPDPPPPQRPGPLPQLTSREADILGSIVMGHTVRQTARLLAIAAKTVENTQGRLFLKLGTRNRAGAIAAAHALGLLDQVSPDQHKQAHRQGQGVEIDLLAGASAREPARRQPAPRRELEQHLERPTDQLHPEHHQVHNCHIK